MQPEFHRAHRNAQCLRGFRPRQPVQIVQHDRQAQRIGQIVLGKRRVTADTDLRLCRYFGLTDGYWLRAQVAFDLEAEKRRIEPELDKIVPVQQAIAL